MGDEGRLRRSDRGDQYVEAATYGRSDVYWPP